MLPLWDSMLHSSRFKSTHVNYFLKYRDFPPFESPAIDRALKVQHNLHLRRKPGDWQEFGHAEAYDVPLLRMDIPALRTAFSPFQSIKGGFMVLREKAARFDIDYFPALSVPRSLHATSPSPV